MKTQDHMHFEEVMNGHTFTSALVSHWMCLVRDRVTTLPRGEPKQHSGCLAEQQVYASLIDGGDRLVIATQVTDDLRVMVSLSVSPVSPKAGESKFQLKVVHYYPGRARKPKTDPREEMVFLATTRVTSQPEPTLEMLADITFECIRQKGYNEQIKALFHAPQSD